MKTILNIVILLQLAASICFAQAIIQGDPTEPCGPIRPDYWIGRRTYPFPRGEEVGVMPKPRQVTKQFNAALIDSYVFHTNARVNDDPPGLGFATPYSSGGHAMAARGDTVYLVWRDDRSGTSAVYFDKSFDSGTTWGTDVAISDNPAAAAVMPALALGKDGTIYVSWTDFRDGNRHIYFAKSTDGGVSFGPSVRVQPATDDKQQFSSIAVNDSGYIFIAYEDFRNLATTAIDIYCSRSTDGGNSFEPSVRVDDCADSINQEEPCIAVRDTNVYIAWTDWRLQPSGSKTYFSKSINSGTAFNNNVLVVDTAGLGVFAANPSSICCDKNNIYIAWNYAKTQNDICFTKSIDDGNTFIVPNLNIIDAIGLPYYQGYPSIVCDESGGVYCAWEDTRNYVNSARQIYMGYSKNYGDSFSLNYHVDDRGLEDSAWFFNPTLSVNKAGKVFCAWADNRVNGAGLTMDIYTTAGTFTGVEGYPGTETLTNSGLALKAYPNPFKGCTNIRYNISVGSIVDINIYNVTGQLVKSIYIGQKSAGEHTLIWDGRDEKEIKVSQGLYFICLKSNGKNITQKITLIK
jgi:hypothetical protein